MEYQKGIKIARRLRISGRVQGVGYRAWMVRAASARGLDGWVRNREDGSVEALIKGEADTVEAMIAACRKGPLAAKVTDIRIEEAKGIVPSGFVKKPTV